MFVICPKCASKYRIPAEITLKEGQKLQCSACRHVFNFQQEKEQELNESFEYAVQVPKDPVLVSEEVTLKEDKIVYSKELPEVFQPLPMSTKTNYMWLWVLFCLGVLIAFIFGVWYYRDTLRTDYTNISFPLNRPIPQAQRSIQITENETFPLHDDKISSAEEIPFYFADDDKVVSKTSINTDNFHFHSVRFRYETNSLLIEGVIRNDSEVSQFLPSAIYATAYNNQGEILFQKEIFLANEVIAPYGQKAFFSTYSPAPDGVQWIEVSCKK